MKSQFVRFASVLVFLATCSVAQADLGDVMKDMASAVKAITASDPASANLCDQLLGDITTARAIMPDTVQKLDQADQPAAMAKYQGMLDTLSTQVTQLKADVVANNSDAIKNDLNAIGQTKVTGHKAFKGN